MYKNYNGELLHTIETERPDNLIVGKKYEKRLECATPGYTHWGREPLYLFSPAKIQQIFKPPK